MEIFTKHFKRCDLVTLKGRIDSETAGKLAETLKAVTDSNVYRIVLDMAEVNFVSSKGWWVLINAQKLCKRHKGELVMVSLDIRIRASLDTVGMGNYFRILEDLTAAVGSF
jgi:anti-anti-sigma factor